MTGQPGIGKTAFAVRLAHAIAGDYPGGNLFVRVSGESIAPGRPLSHISPLVSALEAAYGRAGAGGSLRELTHGRRVLFVLDDVQDESEIAPMLEVDPACCVIATSRLSLDLNDQAVRVALGPLTVHEAVDLLMLQLGEGGVDRVADPGGAAAELVQAAGLYPLAVRMAGFALANAPYWTLPSALERLRQLEREDVIEPFDGLDVSYALLADEERTAVDVIGALENRIIAPWMLSALLKAAGRPGTDDVTAQILDGLVRARFLEQFSTDAAGVPLFRVHDQILIYARRRAENLAPDGPGRYRSAVAEAQSLRSDLGLERRVIEGALEAMGGGRFDRALRLARDGVSMGRENRDPSFEATGLVALAEIHAELGATRQAEELVHAARAILGEQSSPYALRCAGKIDRRLRRLDSAEALLRQAAASATDAADDWEAVHVARELAVVLAERGRPSEGLEVAQRAIDTASSLGPAAASLLPGVMWALARTLLRGDGCDEALATLERADRIARDTGRVLWGTWIAYERARAFLQSGDAAHASEQAAHASRLFTEIRHEYGAAYCEVLLGESILAGIQRPVDAARALEWAFDTFQRCGDPWIEAETARLLASVRIGQRQMRQAARLLGQAESTFDELGDEERAARVRRQYLSTRWVRRRSALNRQVRRAADVVAFGRMGR